MCELGNAVRRQAEHQNACLEGPVSVALEVTKACNERCAYCYALSRRAGRSAGEQDTLRALHVLKRLLQTPTLKQVTLTGGEPFLRKDLLDIVDCILVAGPGPSWAVGVAHDASQRSSV